MHARGLLGLVLLVVSVGSLPSLRPATPPALRSASGSPVLCLLPRAEAELRCRIPGGPLCSGRGRCDCGVCICQVTEAGKYYGPLCECQDWVCEIYDGKVCAVLGGLP